MKAVVAYCGIGECEELVEDPQYINICVEHTNYTPIHMDEVLQRIKDNTKNEEENTKSGGFS